MSHRPYPSYQDSGAVWLGAIPQHWGLAPLKYQTGFLGGGTPSKDNVDFWNGDIPWVSPKDMKTATIAQAEDMITSAAVRESSTKIIPVGAVLVVVRSGILKHSIPTAINSVKVALNQDMKALVLKSKLHSRYVRWLIDGNQKGLLLAWSKQGATVESIEQEYLANVIFPTPPLEEQSAIADFLDRETAKIDTLIDKQERLIKLLEEKRQAVISHAVTKGLNPDVRMKDSGVEWLGEVPEHWAVRRLGSYGEFVAGCGFPHEFQGQSMGQFPFFKVSDTNLDGNEKYLRIANNYVDEATADLLGARIAPAGGIMFPKVGAALLGNKRRILAVDSITDNNTMVFVPRDGDSSYWYYWLLEIDFGQISNPGPVPSVNESQLRDFVALCPPRQERQEIAAHLDNWLASSSPIVAHAERAIALLQERRVALISAAVTGKIDVRNAV